MLDNAHYTESSLLILRYQKRIKWYNNNVYVAVNDFNTTTDNPLL